MKCSILNGLRSSEFYAKLLRRVASSHPFFDWVQFFPIQSVGGLFCFEKEGGMGWGGRRRLRQMIVAKVRRGRCRREQSRISDYRDVRKCGKFYRSTGHIQCHFSHRVTQGKYNSGARRSNWIFHWKLKYSDCCLRDVKLKIERDLSTSI